MSDLLPARFEDSREVSLLGYRRQMLARRRIDNSVIRHNRESIARAEMDKTDSIMLGEMVTTAFEEEVRLYDYGMMLAAGSGTKLELLARKVDLFSQTNNQRISRRTRG